MQPGGPAKATKRIIGYVSAPFHIKFMGYSGVLISVPLIRL